MAQRAIVFEVENGAWSVVDIFEWAEDRLDLNKRRLLRDVKLRKHGDLLLSIEQVDGPRRGEKLYERKITV